MSDRVDSELPNGPISRRDFVGLGAMTIGGATLADPFAGQVQAASAPTTAVIQLFLSGGPSQVDTFDPKPGAPVGYRGLFAATKTNIVGIQLSELFPRLAHHMDKLSIVRSLTHTLTNSSAAQHLTFTGFAPLEAQPTTNERPAVGAVAAAVRGPRTKGVPAYVFIPRILPFGGAAPLPITDEPFELSDPGPTSASLRTIRPAIALDAARAANLAKNNLTLPGMGRGTSVGMSAAAVAAASQTAMTQATNPAVANALNVAKESAATLALYGQTALGQRLLIARRLIEAGVTFVTVEDTGWAMSSSLEQQMSQKAPVLDQALSALVTDLSQRDLYKSVLVVVHGEFGRSAKLNSAQGRDNSPSVYSVLLGGGGLKTAQVIGSSDAMGQTVQTLPHKPGDVLATIYSVLGIDLHKSIPDAKGKPDLILASGAPIAGLV
jgi:hypothetical protein